MEFARAAAALGEPYMKAIHMALGCRRFFDFESSVGQERLIALFDIVTESPDVAPHALRGFAISRDSQERIEATLVLEFLARIDAPTALEIAMTLCGDEEELVRISALAALSRIRDGLGLSES